MINATPGAAGAAVKWQTMAPPRESPSAAGPSALTVDAQTQTLPVEPSRRIEQTLNAICSQILGALTRFDDQGFEIGNEVFTPDEMSEADRSRFLHVVENSLGLNLIDPLIPLSEGLAGRALMRLTQDRVRARLNPDVLWLADGLAAIGERRYAAAMQASRPVSRPEPEGWLNFGGDVFGPEVEDAFSDPASEVGSFLDDARFEELLHRFVRYISGALMHFRFAGSGAGPHFRWAGYGVDRFRGIDDERRALIMATQSERPNPPGRQVPQIAGSSAAMQRALSVAGSRELALAPNVNWLNTCYPSIT
ncbi:hypothetical protein [Pandoraea sp. PE-S2T-3]|uniref:hypothetical protein n=1 Tax=Pandoraea sp. PE-S2T-3 TaxID=1986993 RepID=UPI000B3FB419|nr:hypothetical protein [Pandoraea sp. PE-S2T-3]